jgi:hypothetical protein
MMTLTPPGGTGDVANTYDTSGRISMQDNPDGDVLEYSYSGNPSTEVGGVTTVTGYPDGLSGGSSEVWTFTYSSNVLVAETSGAGTGTAGINASTTYYERDPATLVPYAEFGGDGGATAQVLATQASGALPVGGDVLTSTDAMGNTTEYAYTADNLPWCTMEPAEYAEATATDGTTCASLTPPISAPTAGSDPYPGMTVDYYSSDRLISSTDPLGNTTLYGYTPSGGSEPAGLQYCTIDPAEYLLVSTCPSYDTTEAGIATKTFDSSGDVMSSTTPGGATTVYSYGVTGYQGLVSSETVFPDGGTAPQGDTTTFTYDSVGQVTSETKTSAASGNVCALYQFTKGFVVSIPISPGDVATDHRVLLVV